MRDKKADILGYRDQRYTSVLTGTRAPQHHTRWIEEMDDSLERFLLQPARSASGSTGKSSSTSRPLAPSADLGGHHTPDTFQRVFNRQRTRGTVHAFNQHIGFPAPGSRCIGAAKHRPFLLVVQQV